VFFKFFANLSPEFRESALAAVQTRLDNGDHPSRPPAPSACCGPTS